MATLQLTSPTLPHSFIKQLSSVSRHIYIITTTTEQYCCSDTANIGWMTPLRPLVIPCRSLSIVCALFAVPWFEFQSPFKSLLSSHCLVSSDHFLYVSQKKCNLIATYLYAVMTLTGLFPEKGPWLLDCTIKLQQGEWNARNWSRGKEKLCGNTANAGQQTVFEARRLLLAQNVLFMPCVCHARARIPATIKIFTCL